MDKWPDGGFRTSNFINDHIFSPSTHILPSTDESDWPLPLIRLDKLLSVYFDTQTLRPATLRGYRTATNLLIKDNSIEFIEDVTERILLSWKKDILARATATTWNNYHTHLRALFNFALKRGWIKENIFLTVTQVTPPRLKKKTIQISSLKIILDTLEEFQENFEPQWFWLTLIKLFYYTGMRRQQLISLKWKDIDLVEKMILLSLEGSKTHREWFIPMPDECYEPLKILKERSKIELDKKNAFKENKFIKNINEEYVFKLQLFTDKYQGTVLSSEQVAGFFKKLSRYSGEIISSHRLRHTMATQVAQSGENPDIRSLQYIMGHTNIRTTLEYVEPQTKHLRTVINKLPKI